MNGFYSVFNPKGEKIADCGALRDAINLVGSRNKNWDGHYYQFKPVYETIDMKSNYLSGVGDNIKELPTDNIIVNMDGGVGGSWQVESQPVLEQNDAEVFTPE